jgi:hypothetical protein
MPTVTIVNELNNTYPSFNRSWDGVHGKWIITLYDTDGSSPKYVLQVKDTSNNVVGEMRQSANEAGYAHFDIAPIVRTKVKGSPDIEQTNVLAVAEDETFAFTLAAGYEDASGVAVMQSVDPVSEYATQYQAFNVVKRYDELDWEWEDYAADFYETSAGPLTFNIIYPSAKALTELSYTEPIDAKTPPCWSDYYPTALQYCYPIKLGRDEDFTLSWLNRADCYDGNEEFTEVQTITHFVFSFFKNDGTTDSIDIVNSLTNGGGPNTNPETGPNQPDTYPYGAVTLQVGIRNPNIAAVINSGDWDYYYVAPLMMRNPESPQGIGSCTFTVPDTATIAGVAYRIDLTDGECNDFDQIQVSWLNKFGFRDYFTFQKRDDKQVNITRNEFNRNQGSWNSQTFNLNTYDRGRTVYSQDITESRTLNTRYLKDEESNYLRGLYESPDVRAKINGEWIPVILTSNTWTEQTYRKDKLFQHTITFEFANRQISQQG